MARGYTLGVTSRVAASIRKDQRRSDRERSPLERLLLAQRLGDEAAAQYSRAHGVPAGTATREFARRRQLGRRPSRCLSAP